LRLAFKNLKTSGCEVLSNGCLADPFSKPSPEQKAFSQVNRKRKDIINTAHPKPHGTRGWRGLVGCLTHRNLVHDVCNALLDSQAAPLN
jgi:hypothetical protein